MLDTTQREYVYFVNLATNILSILGCMFILLVYCFFPTLHTFPFKLVLILSIFDLCNSIGFAIPTYSTESSNNLLCLAQSIMINYFTLASILWILFIAFCLYFIIVRSILYMHKFLIAAFIAVLILSGCTTMAPIITHSYHSVSGWCWIRQTSNFDTGFYERYALFFIPVWVIIFLVIFLYSSVSRRLKLSQNIDKDKRSLNRKLKNYPILMVLCFLPYTVKSILDFMTIDNNGTDYEFWFTMICGFLRGINGFLNAILYGLTKKVRKNIQSWWNNGPRESQDILYRRESLRGTQCTALTKQNIVESRESTEYDS
jgi:hypothetical protein